MLTGLATLFVVSVVVFGAMHLIPGSFADVVLGPYASPEARAEIRTKYGLDKPLPVQYVEWLQKVGSGDFGVTTGTQVPVSEVLRRRVPVTIELAFLSLLLSMCIGLPLALFAGISRSRFGTGASRLGGAISMSTPEFVTGSVFVYLFSRYRLGLNVGGYVPLTQSPADNLRSMFLPALTLSFFGIALIVRIGRDAVANVLSEPYLTAALARGETTAHVIRHHVLRNAAIPVVTVLAVYAGYLMGGAVIVENLFSVPGLGQAALVAIQQRDYAIVQGVVLVGAAAFIAINMLADITYGLIDPRLRVVKT